MKWPSNNIVKINSLKYNKDYTNDFAIKKAEILSYDDNVNFIRDQDCLKIYSKAFIDSEYPVCIKITID